MSLNRRPSQFKSDSRITEILRQHPRINIESTNSRLISTNQIPIPTRNINQKSKEQRQNKENTRYNNIMDKSQKENNVRYNNNNYFSKKEEKYNANNNDNSYNNKNDKLRTYKFDISKYRNKNKKENADIKINNDNPMSKSENINKPRIENINNNNINKRNIDKNSLNNNNEDNDKNKFGININKYIFVYNKNTESIKTPRIKISDIIDKNNNSASYYNKYSQKTSIAASNRSKINQPVKIIETEISNRRNNRMNNSATINKNNSFSAGLNLLYHKDKLDKQESSIPQNSFRHYNIPQPISIINQNKNKSSNYLLGENHIKERAHSSFKNSNIYLKTELISNKNKDEDNEKNTNTNIITRVVSHRKNNNINTNINQNNNNNKNDKKSPSYSNTQIKNDKKEIKEKEKEKGIQKLDNKKKDNIIQRKEEKIYISKKPQINNSNQDNKENNNVAITYISNIKKVENKKNSSNNSNDNNSETKNISSNNNSITYIKTSSSKKDKNKDENENIIIPHPKNLNNYYSSINNKDNIKINNINNKSENNIDKDKNKTKDDEIINLKNDIQINNNINEKESKEKNITPIKSINILENNLNNDININQNNNINKSIEINNSSIKNLTSSNKLEQKIKELESKLDDLNNNTESIFNISEPINSDYDYKYSLLNKTGLSDITKEYLSTFLEESMPKTELSDFSKAYMIQLDDYNMINERPTLSVLTKEFLKENDDNKDIKEEINDEKKLDNNQ